MAKKTRRLPASRLQKTQPYALHLGIVSITSLVILFGSIFFFSALKSSLGGKEGLDRMQLNSPADKILVDAEIKPGHYVYYVLRRPANMSGNLKIYASLQSEDSFDIYIFGNKDDIKDSSAKPISTMLLMKNLNRTFPIEEGNVMVLANSRDKTVNISGVVEYTE